MLFKEIVKFRVVCEVDLAVEQMSLGPSLALQLLATPCCHCDLALSDLLKLSCAVLHFGLLWMGCFGDLSGLNAFDCEKVSWNVVVNADIWSVFHLFQVHQTFGFDKV
jgi:hypothetical protein